MVRSTHPINTPTYLRLRDQIRAESRDVAAAQQDLILRVSQAYFDVLNAENQLAVIRAQKAAITITSVWV